MKTAIIQENFVSRGQLPPFMQQWLNVSAPELESYHQIIEKISQYLIGTPTEASLLEKEIIDLYTNYYLELGKLKRQSFIHAMQGFRDLATDFEITDLHELDRILTKVQQGISRRNLMTNIQQKKETTTGYLVSLKTRKIISAMMPNRIEAGLHFG